MRPFKNITATGPDFKKVARMLTVVENDLPGYVDVLKSLQINSAVPITGITGAPGAGKSTLVNAVINELSSFGKKVAVLAIDPTSPFNFGSILGDRIRMSSHFNDPNVFIRSVATRGSLGGLSAKTIEMSDVLRASGFDQIIIETVGVGQSEVEIAGLADNTLVVLVPESGDEIQNIKSGIMEIADAFIINKADLSGADSFYNSLKKLLTHGSTDAPIYKAVASRHEGLKPIVEFISKPNGRNDQRKVSLMTEKAWQIIRNRRMADVDRKKLQQIIAEALIKKDLNLYKLIDEIADRFKL